MNKPKKIKLEMYDYHECEEYIAHKLGIKDLRDMLGKFQSTPYDNAIEYRDYWHYIMDKNDVHNPCQIWIFDDEFAKSWQQEVTKAFFNEFGEGPYWVSW